MVRKAASGSRLMIVSNVRAAPVGLTKIFLFIFCVYIHKNYRHIIIVTVINYLHSASLSAASHAKSHFTIVFCAWNYGSPHWGIFVKRHIFNPR
jgi:hypothetical protein